MACGRLLLDIDHRMVHIVSQVSLGADKDEVVTEQYHALLAAVSMLRGVGLEDISRVSNHLVAQGVFCRKQLLAFSASLRAAAATASMGKPPARQMQSNEALEHCLLQLEWD